MGVIYRARSETEVSSDSIYRKANIPEETPLNSLSIIIRGIRLKHKEDVRIIMCVKDENNFSEDLLPIGDYLSAEALKDEIRQRIQNRLRDNWNFCNISSQGGFISLSFRQ